MAKRSSSFFLTSLICLLFCIPMARCGGSTSDSRRYGDGVTFWHAVVASGAFVCGHLCKNYADSTCRAVVPLSNTAFRSLDRCDAAEWAAFYAGALCVGGCLALLLLPDVRQALFEKWVSLAPSRHVYGGKLSRQDRIAAKRERHQDAWVKAYDDGRGKVAMSHKKQ